MSIKICIISPASHLSDFSPLGDCEMALTHLVIPELMNNEEALNSRYVRQYYASYYENQAALGRWVILDNSAYEIGKLEATQASGQGLGPALVLKAAEIVKPSIVIAQDVLCDRQATLESTKDFIKYVKDKGLFGNFQLMAVAQGRTKDEWLSSYEDLYKLPEINQIGFSKISVPLSFGGNQAEPGCVAIARLACTQAVNEAFQNSTHTEQFGKCASVTTNGPKPAHLLGGDNFLPWELSQQKQYKWIFSNDSSAAVWYGGHGKKYNREGKIQSIITEKPDLENLSLATLDKMGNNKDSIYYNISMLHKFSKC
jgi:hypothetical protein